MGDSVISGKHYHFAPAELWTPPVARLPLVAIRKPPDGRPSVRDLAMESKVQMRSGVPTVVDPYPVAGIELDVEGVEWLLEELDPDNTYTAQIAFAAAIGRHTLWDRIRNFDWHLAGDEP